LDLLAHPFLPFGGVVKYPTDNLLLFGEEGLCPVPRCSVVHVLPHRGRLVNSLSYSLVPGLGYAHPSGYYSITTGCP